MKTVLLSKMKTARTLVVLGLMLVGSLSLSVTGLFDSTAHAAMTADQCYAFNGQANPATDKLSNMTPEGKQLNDNKQECIDLGYCEHGSVASGMKCSEEIYQASDQYQEYLAQQAAAQKELEQDTILNAQIAPLLPVICGSPSVNQNADAEYADCASKVKAQYVTCKDAAYNYGGDDVAGYISSCMLRMI